MPTKHSVTFYPIAVKPQVVQVKAGYVCLLRALVQLQTKMLIHLTLAHYDSVAIFCAASHRVGVEGGKVE